MLQGTSFLVLLFVSFEVYSDFDQYKSKLVNLWAKAEEPFEKKVRAVPDIIDFALPKPLSVPGVYLWGLNNDRVVKPESSVRHSKYPERLSFFDGLILRDLKLNTKIADDKDGVNIYLNTATQKPPIDSSGLAIDQHGDVIQWGKGFSKDSPLPAYTVKGKNFVRAEFSNKTVYLMDLKNRLYSMPVEGTGNKEVRRISTEHKIVDYQTGVGHLLVLTNKGKVYSAKTGQVEDYGQCGLLDKASDMNSLNEVYLLNNEVDKKVLPRHIVQISSGNYHSLAVDTIGNIYSFGRNTYGQCGFKVTYSTESITVPKHVNYFQGYFGKMDQFAVCKRVWAGANSSYAEIVPKSIREVFLKSMGEKRQELDAKSIFFAFGKGLYGQLGLGYYVHSNGSPKVVGKLNLPEYNEAAGKMEDIKVADLAIGKNHTYVSFENSDVMSFGSNKFGQLENGKLINSSSPGHMLQLIEPEDVTDGKIDVTKFAKRVNNRLQLKTEQNCQQVIGAGIDTGVIYYKGLGVQRGWLW